MCVCVNVHIQMRIAHLGSTIAQLCNSQHVLFSDPVAEIGAWLDENEGEFIRLYMNVRTSWYHGFLKIDLSINTYKNIKFRLVYYA